MSDDRQSKMFRLQVGDKVSFQDASEWPPVDLEGEIVDFGNEELSYLVVDFGDDDERTLTEDEVKRIG